MKTRRNARRNAQGSVFLAVLVITVVLGVGAASYLKLMSWQQTAVIRSQAWNSALALAEAGVDEALAQLNPSALIFTTNIDRGANGWSLSADGTYHAPRRTLSDGAYDAAISADPLPIICATGYVTIPTLSITLTRAVRVTTRITTVFRGSMAAILNVDFKGNTVTTDSYDSMDPNYSTGGLYDPAKRKASGDVLSTEGLINVQNAEVMGTLYTGPDGTYDVGSEGAVGDLAWVLGGTKGMQAGHYKNDFNMDFPPVLPPYQTGVTPAGGTIGGTNYTWVLENGNYIVDNPKWPQKFNSGDTILVTGKARLYITGDFIMGGGSQITIAPGGSIELYVGGANTSVTTVNNPGNCSNFSYFGLPGNTTVNLSGNNTFLGSFYAPSADLKLSGGGNSVTDYQGACVARTIGMNGQFNFHFDENLKRWGPIRGYQLASWSET